MHSQNWKNFIGGVLFLTALFFVHRSFYGMRVPETGEELTAPPVMFAAGKSVTSAPASVSHPQPPAKNKMATESAMENSVS
jgi:hypothetical protein